MSPETISLQFSTDRESSGDGAADFIEDSIFTATTVSPAFSTQSSSDTASSETETSSTSKTAFTASSLFSTEKPTAVLPETQESVAASESDEASVTPETSSTFPTTDEESLGEQTTEITSKESTAPTASSLFSTEKPTALPVEEQDSAVTGQTVKPSVSPIIYKTEQSSIHTPSEEDGSGDQTQDMFIETSSVTDTSVLYSTDAPTAMPRGTPESLETDKTQMPSLTGQPSVSPVSDETLTSSITMSPGLASVISSTVTDISDDLISSEPTRVESIPSHRCTNSNATWNTRKS
ncbi:uncharacterized protein ABDE67_000752 [Symphorus nematophorus]